MRFNSFGKILILILVNLFLLFLSLKFFNQKPISANLENYKFEEKEYNLKPFIEDFVSEIQIDFPPVKTPPFSFLYPLIVLKENFYIKKNKYDNLFLANKRVAELERWGSEMPITGKHFGSWQTTLERYNKAIDNHLIKIVSIGPQGTTKTRELLKLKKQLSAHRNIVNIIIFRLYRSEIEKANLENIVDNIFDIINQKINTYLPIPQSNQLLYLLSDLLMEKEYGIYDIYVNLEQIDKSKLPPLLISNKILSIRPLFQNVKIDKYSPEKLILELPRQNSILPEITLYKKLPLNNRPPLSTVYKIKRNQYLIINANTTVDQDNFIINSLGFGWRVIHKSDSNASSQFTIGFWPSRLFFFLWLISLVLVFFSLSYKLYPRQAAYVLGQTYKFFFQTLFVPLLFLWRLLKRFCIRVKLILFFVFFFGITIDILLFELSVNFIVVLLTLFWITLLIGFRAGSKISFIIALVFLTITPLLLIHKKDFIAEKTATWTYIFMTVGIMHSIVELMLKKSNIKYKITTRSLE